METNKIGYSATDDAKQIISQATSIKKERLLEVIWTRMTAEQIREVEQYDVDGTTHYEFTEMFKDFLTLV